MSKIRFLRPMARWLSALMLAGSLYAHLPVQAAQTTVGVAPAPAATAGIIVLDSGTNQVTLSVGEREGVRPGTEFCIMRGTREVARVRVVETSIATSKAVVISGLPASQLLPNDQAVMVGAPAPAPAKAGAKFPWGAVVGAAILAVVIICAIDNDNDESSGNGGIADVRID